MNSAERAPRPGEPLDDVDAAVIGALHDLYAAADPMPADLVDRVQFAIELEDVDVEVMRLTDATLVAPAGARGDEETRTITFDCDSLTVMVIIGSTGDGTIRLDGWLAPPAGHGVELRTAAGRLTTVANEDGRFVLPGVPHGLAQLIVHPTAGSGDGCRDVVTPSIML